MPSIVYVGRPSLHFYGKKLAEIACNLKNFGVGRIVIKETEASKYTEPCYYKLTKVEPFMSDENVYRCRAWAQRTYRGTDMGNVLIEKFYEADWRLVRKYEEGEILSRKVDSIPTRTINCVTEYPPLVAKALIDKFPDKFSVEKPPLMLMKPFEKELDKFDVLSQLNDQEISRLWPPFNPEDTNNRIIPKKFHTTYHIRRSDTPGIYWRVDLEKEKQLS